MAQIICKASLTFCQIISQRMNLSNKNIALGEIYNLAQGKLHEDVFKCLDV